MPQNPTDASRTALVRALVGITAGLTADAVLVRAARAAVELTSTRGESAAALVLTTPDGRSLGAASARGTAYAVVADGEQAAQAAAELLADGATLVRQVLVHGTASGRLLLRCSTCPPGDAEAVADALAAAAGVALGNARLLEQAEQRRRWLEATAEVSSALLGHSDPEAELSLVADRARVVADASLAMILLPAGPDALLVEVVSSSDGTAGKVQGDRVPLVGTLCGQVLSEGEAVVVDDPPPGAAELRGDLLCGDAPPGPALLLPLGNVDDVRGVLALSRPAGAPNFTTVDLALATTFGGSAALALDRARAQSDRAALAVLEDRDRIARDLHDLVIQRLFATGLQLQGMARQADAGVRAKLDSAVDSLDETIREIRTTIFQLNRRPDSVDLRGQLRDVVDEAARPLGFPVSCTLSGPVAEGVPEEVAGHLLAVLRESLSNVAKHAGATAASVTVEVGRDVVLVVEDDGRGYVEDRHGSGMRNMRSRATKQGGRLTVSPRASGGTRLEWRVPLPVG
ncbi:histidine kinase/DNA gyrase B/HSP90-like ATPase [Motilibacter rhizosphaerae]|uniref:Histidine kinase/DNA gyrase B/HSP90-like ATPase n=1 Tax=Motilibacter rhizosphaerae TaxID=598652 RepID=A0A4Q7NVT1_9ACTN|nr:histidine kinase [Motilibacter rhizosphaerae]RZS91383.1 histidine kinase/DNA gyrase B/HSP90-like ATPase [Motilibacter rhizosphaerae]